MAASDSFNRKNLNRTIAKSLELLDEVTPLAKKDGVEIRVGIATSFHCPFEGTISTSALLAVVKAVRERCQWKVGIADTDGMAFPDQVTDVVNGLHQKLKLPLDEIALHFHDTYGRGLSNVLAGLKTGIREDDSTTAGLGGCPYCPGESGNLAAMHLLACLHGMGFQTGNDMEKLLYGAE